MQNILGSLKHALRSSSRLFIIFCFLSIGAIGLSACKKQPAATTISAEEEQLAQVKAELRKLLTNTNMSLTEKEEALARIKSMNLTDPEVLSLIAQVESMLARARTEENQRLEQERLRAEEQARLEKEANAPENILKNFFSQISSGNNSDLAISQALNMFTSPESPVLIIISKMSDGTPDYDRPTTIQKYLQYLKDQKAQAPAIENIIFDGNGKIKELELTKLK